MRILSAFIIALAIVGCSSAPKRTSEATSKPVRFTNWAMELDSFITGQPMPKQTEATKEVEETDEAEELAALQSDTPTPARENPERLGQVQSILKNNIGNMARCISTNRPNQKDGQVTIFFQVNPTGEVQRVGLGENKLLNKDKACLIESVYGLIFPPSLAQSALRVQQPIYY